MAKDGGIVIMASCQIEIAVGQRKTGSFRPEISLKGLRNENRSCQSQGIDHGVNAFFPESFCEFPLKNR